MTRRTTSTRSSSLALILTSSWAIRPAPERHHVAESGHLYLARSGHFHVASTGQRTDKRGSVASALSLIPSSATRTRQGGATPRRAGGVSPRACRSADRARTAAGRKNSGSVVDANVL